MPESLLFWLAGCEVCLLWLCVTFWCQSLFFLNLLSGDQVLGLTIFSFLSKVTTTSPSL